MEPGKLHRYRVALWLLIALMAILSELMGNQAMLFGAEGVRIAKHGRRHGHTKKVPVNPQHSTAEKKLEITLGLIAGMAINRKSEDEKGAGEAENGSSSDTTDVIAGPNIIGDAVEMGDDVGKEEDDVLLYGRAAYRIASVMDLFVQGGYGINTKMQDPQAGGELHFSPAKHLLLYLGGFASAPLSDESKELSRLTSMAGFAGVQYELGGATLLIEGLAGKSLYNKTTQDEDTTTTGENAYIDESDGSRDDTRFGGSGSIEYEFADDWEIEVGASLTLYNMMDGSSAWESEAAFPRLGYELGRMTFFGEFMLFSAEDIKLSAPSLMGVKGGIEVKF